MKNNIKKNLRIFLCGDVMVGRGIDQILPYPSHPQLYEVFVTNAQEYIFLAEKVNGKIPYPVSMSYIWGEALSVWQQLKPDIKIINLETAITTVVPLQIKKFSLHLASQKDCQWLLQTLNQSSPLNTQLTLMNQNTLKTTYFTLDTV